MAPESRSLSQELPQQAAWVRRLARRLVRDDAAADDVAQEAALAALRHGTALRGELRPWLARVTASLAARAWRSESSRARVERAGARTEALPAAEEPLERLEAQRGLLEELAQLSEPCRSSVIRRYLDGQSAARIARETGVPAATVRWRIQRGLAELRERLERRGGKDGRDWRLALLPLCRAPSWTLDPSALPQGTTAFVTSLPGALAMKLSVQLAAAGALALAAAGIWWSLRPTTDGTASAAPAPLVTLEPASPAERTDPLQPAPGSSARQALPEAEPEPRAGAPLPPEARTLVDGRCVDEELRGIPAAAFLEHAREGARSTSSGPDGAFSLECSPAKPSEGRVFRVEAPGRATRFVEAALARGEITHLGDVVLGPGGSVRGQVVDPLGQPFAGAEVLVTPPDLWGDLEAARRRGPSKNVLGPTGRSGAGGRFRVDGVTPGKVRAWASAEGMRHAISAPLEVLPHGETEEVRLVLEPIESADRIAGIVLAPDGTPVPGAGLGGLERSPSMARSIQLQTDADGRFEMTATSGHFYDLQALDPMNRWSEVSADGVRPGTADLVLRFREARWIEVAVHADGEPVAEYELSAVHEEPGRHNVLEQARGPHPEGRTRLRVPNLSFAVEVDAQGFALEQQGPFDPAAPPETLEFTLVPQPGIHGRVLAGDEPLAGALVELYEGAWPQERILCMGYLSRVRPGTVEETRTDDEGRFVLHPRESGSYHVRAEAEGLAPGDLGPLDIDPALGARDLEIVLGPGGALEGRVLLPPGRDPTGVIVAVNRGDAHPRTLRSDAEGRFRFEGLTPGPWQLLAGKLEVLEGQGGTSYSGTQRAIELPFNCEVLEGRTTRADLDLRDWRPSEIRGELLVNGQPARDWIVTARPGDEFTTVGPPPSTAVDARGSFTLSLDDPGPVGLSLRPPVESGGEGAFDVTLEVVPGPNTWRADLAMGRLSGSLPAPGSPDELLSYSSDEGVVPSCWFPIVLDAENRFVLPFVPAGPGRITLRAPQAGRWQREVLAEVDIPAGGERSVRVP